LPCLRSKTQEKSKQTVPFSLPNDVNDPSAGFGASPVTTILVAIAWLALHVCL